MSLDKRMSTWHMGRLWVTEWVSPKEAHMHGLEEIIYEGRTKYQHVLIARTFAFGKTLFLDGYVQSTELDEAIYHEALVHPAMLTHPSPRKVAIIGGGEGATLREVLKHRSVERVVMVDIDSELIELCKKFLPEWSKGAFDDPRVELIFSDGRRFIEETGEKFDVIILDLTDPAEGTPGIKLYTKEFYEAVYNALSEDGVAVTQATSIRYYLFAFTAIRNTLSKVFPKVRPYKIFIPAFLCEWGFMLASKSRDPLELSEEEIRERIRDLDLIFYDEEAHRFLFWIPKFVRKKMDEIDLVSTDSNPLIIY